MPKNYIDLLIDDNTSSVCDDFLLTTSARYDGFMSIIKNTSLSQEDMYHLENYYLLQTREAINFGYRSAIQDVFSNVLNARTSHVHRDHILTTQTMNNPHLSR